VPEAAVVAWIQAAIQLCSAVQLCLPRSGIYKGDNIPLESSSCSSVNSYISCVQLDAECLLRLCPCNIDLAKLTSRDQPPVYKGLLPTTPFLSLAYSLSYND
jgi:hypothetical protein